MEYLNRGVRRRRCQTRRPSGLSPIHRKEERSSWNSLPRRQPLSSSNGLGSAERDEELVALEERNQV
eukprot:scaffold79434_cov32-Tisochrysis_lutea.AAC.3